MKRVREPLPPFRGQKVKGDIVAENQRYLRKGKAYDFQTW